VDVDIPKIMANLLSKTSWRQEDLAATQLRGYRFDKALQSRLAPSSVALVAASYPAS
jgi:hypothetical protein